MSAVQLQPGVSRALCALRKMFQNILQTFLACKLRHKTSAKHFGKKDFYVAAFLLEMNRNADVGGCCIAWLHSLKPTQPKTLRFL